jgi:cell division protein FtsB
MVRVRPTRLLALGGILLLGFLYWKPIKSYRHTKHELAARRAQISVLRAEQAKLEQRIAAAGTPTELSREARRLGLVKPGERLFIVRGIAAWRHKNRP